jgi:hypothetical protein
MTMDTIVRKCLACSGTNLQYGEFGVHRHTFMPEKKVMWTGYAVNGYACLDCGTLGYYLKEQDLEEMRNAQAKKNG